MIVDLGAVPPYVDVVGIGHYTPVSSRILKGGTLEIVLQDAQDPGVQPGATIMIDRLSGNSISLSGWTDTYPFDLAPYYRTYGPKGD